MCSSDLNVRRSQVVLSIYTFACVALVGDLTGGPAEGSCASPVIGLGWLLASGWAVVELWQRSATRGIPVVVGALAWGVGLSCLGVVFCQTASDPPYTHDSTWHVIHAGFPFRRVARLVQDNFDGADIHLHREPGHEFGGNQDLPWWCLNAMVFGEIGRAHV